MSLPPIDILYRDDDFLVVNKPAGLSTTSPHGGDCLVQRVGLLDPGAPRLHPSSRLDAEVTGVLIFARNRVATQALLTARQQHAYKRLYKGLVQLPLSPPDGVCVGAIGIDRHDPRKRCVLPEDSATAKRAHTRYATVASLEDAHAVHLWPETGRTHQLRVHMAHAGSPLLGDRHYGGVTRIVRTDGRVVRVPRVMLHCARVSIPGLHGDGGHDFRAQVPADMAALWQALGGDGALLEQTPD